jgi:hypothetical protein
MLNDISKSNCIKLFRVNGKDIVVRTNEIKKFPQTKELLDKIESQLSPDKRDKIISHLNIMANLTPEEADFHKKLVSKMVQFTKNGKLAYIIIEPENQEWKKLGQDNIITSTILSNVRKRLLENSPNDKLIPDNLRKKLSKVKGVIIFYRGEEKDTLSDEIYRMSIHSKNKYAKKLIKFIKNNLDSKIVAGGHSNRAGGRIFSIKPDDCNAFISKFLFAAENLNPFQRFLDKLSRVFPVLKLFRS